MNARDSCSTRHPDRPPSPAPDAPAPVFEVRELEIRLGEQHVLGPLDLRLARGSFVGILGPNGSGKTTLLRALTGALRPSAGEIELEDRPLREHHAIDVARAIGVVPQSFTLDFSFTVEEMVAMGRYAHVRPATHDRTPDRQDAVAAAIEATGLAELAERPVTQLSGGERQRALIAQTLAQDTPTLLLDEPLNNLDLNHQLEIMQLLRALHSQGRTIAVVLHDINMAAQYCEELLVLDGGRIVAHGPPAEVLDPHLILEVFKTRVAVHRQGRRPYVTPVWSDPAADIPGLELRRVHVLAGGGAATAVIEELVACGHTPTVGVVSVFDTDYATAQAYGLEVVSSPPFEAFSAETMREFDAHVAEADTVIIAPVFFGRGNLAPLHSAIRAAKTGTRVIVVATPPISQRDLADGEATRLISNLLEAGAVEAHSPAQAVGSL